MVYNAGTDCLIGDPLGDLKITAKGISRRDETVFAHCLEKHKETIPVVMILSGGYQMSNAKVIADSVQNLISRFQLGPESKIRNKKGRVDNGVGEKV